MVVWDDMNLFEPIRIYDKGVAREPYYNSFGEFQLRLRDVNVMIPKLRLAEPLRLQAEAFLSEIRNGKGVRSRDVASGLRVVQCLEGVDRSLARDGKRIYLNSGRL